MTTDVHVRQNLFDEARAADPFDHPRRPLNVGKNIYRFFVETPQIASL
jgi:hypothetical protein